MRKNEGLPSPVAEKFVLTCTHLRYADRAYSGFFWWFSIGGGLILFAYALHRRDPVFILGQSLGIFIYARNLWLVHAEKRST